MRHSLPTAIRASAAALLILLATALAAPVDAKLKDHGRWVFEGSDRKEKWGGKNDPMTILYKGGRNPHTKSRRETSTAISLMLEDWRDGDMRPRVCPTAKWLVYRLFPGWESDKTDLNVTTSKFCSNQWHSRIWNDREINERAQWEVGGIHREERVWCCGHRLTMSFENAENRALKNMSRYCSVPNWRALPGSGPKKYKRSYGSFYSNGKISRISMKQVDHSKPTGSKCRGAFR